MRCNFKLAKQVEIMGKINVFVYLVLKKLNR